MAARIPHRPAPRYRPGGGAANKGRLWGAVVTLIGAGVVATAILHTESLTLRCEDGRIEAYGPGILPWERAPLDDPALPPLAISGHHCRDVTLESRAALVSAYTSIVALEIDDALQSESPQKLALAERALGVLESLEDPDAPAITSRRQALVVAQLRADLAQARAARLRAAQRLRLARELGVKPSTVAAFERELGTLVPEDKLPPSTSDVSEVEAPGRGL